MIYFLAPAYNEAKNLPTLVASINEMIKKNYRLVIVNDGSIDNTVIIARQLSKTYPLVLIGYKTNRGPGYAFNFGFEYLVKKLKRDDVVITIESDNTSDLSAIDKMIQLSNSYDIIIGSPLKGEGGFVGVSFYRRFLSQLNHLLFKIIFRIKGADSYGNFFRLYTAQIIKRAKRYYGSSLITENGFSAVTELLIKLNKIGARIISIPTKVDWSKREGKSKLKIAKYIRRQIMLIIKFWILSKLNLAPRK